MKKAASGDGSVEQGVYRTISFYCPIELLEPLRRIAFESGVSRSKLIVEALEECIEEYRRIYPDFDLLEGRDVSADKG